MTQPTVTFDKGAFIVTLWRSNAEQKWVFDNCTITIRNRHEKTLDPLIRESIKGPAAPNGILYYIDAEPKNSVDVNVRVWLINRDEADAVDIALLQADDDAEVHHDFKCYMQFEAAPCSVCAKPHSECYENHGDMMVREMRMGSHVRLSERFL